MVYSESGVICSEMRAVCSEGGVVCSKCGSSLRQWNVYSYSKAVCSKSEFRWETINCVGSLF